MVLMILVIEKFETSLMWFEICCQVLIKCYDVVLQIFFTFIFTYSKRRFSHPDPWSSPCSSTGFSSPATTSMSLSSPAVNLGQVVRN